MKPPLLFVALVTALMSGDAAAQNAGDVFNIFKSIMRSAVVDHAKKEWSRVAPNDASCIDQALQEQGYSISTLIQNGTLPTDPAISNIRSGCRSSTTMSPPSHENSAGTQELSAKPTFDCTKATTPTSHIVCLDQAGAKADWDLISASWARYSLSQKVIEMDLIKLNNGGWIR